MEGKKKKKQIDYCCQLKNSKENSTVALTVSKPHTNLPYFILSIEPSKKVSGRKKKKNNKKKYKKSAVT